MGELDTPPNLNGANGNKELVGSDRAISREIDAGRVVEKQDFWEFIFRSFDQREQLVIYYLYVENLTMKETGNRIVRTDVDGFEVKKNGGLVLTSESRISQLHSSIIDRLRARFGHLEPEKLSDLLVGFELPNTP
jgi:DNA-directed RNA polymerase specialized sigma subunit